MPPLPRLLRLLGWSGLAAGVLWLGALMWFVSDGLLLRADPPGESDAIVVLTGGRLRVETGLDLLASGAAKKLFISGVNQRVDRDELLRALGTRAEHAACCIVIGHQADNTVGNARETAHWMRQEGYRSLRLVTSWYHLKRSLLEFRRSMPDIKIVTTPVFAPHLAAEHWWSWHGVPLVVIREYNKYLAARLRPLLEAAWPIEGGEATARRR